MYIYRLKAYTLGGKWLKCINLLKLALTVPFLIFWIEISMNLSIKTWKASISIKFCLLFYDFLEKLVFYVAKWMKLGVTLDALSAGRENVVVWIIVAFDRKSWKIHPSLDKVAYSDQNSMFFYHFHVKEKRNSTASIQHHIDIEGLLNVTFKVTCFVSKHVQFFGDFCDTLLTVTSLILTLESSSTLHFKGIFILFLVSSIPKLS